MESQRPKVNVKVNYHHHVRLEMECVFVARRGAERREAEEGWTVKDQRSMLRPVIIITFCMQATWVIFFTFLM